MSMDWQVESGLRNAIFLSATSSDLGECRRVASDILQQAGILPVVQDYFGPDTRTIEELLRDKILAANAVLCLVGHAFGAAPTVDGKISARSYTQMEHDLALRYGKPVYLFVATDAFAKAHPVEEAEELRASQEAHRRKILTESTKYDEFSTVEELKNLVHALVPPMLAHAGRRAIKFVHVPPAPACFVGRKSEVDQISDGLEKPRPSLMVILGMGGQGKTTLLAHALREGGALPFAAGIWVSAERGGFAFSEFLDAALSEFMGRNFQKAEMPRLDARLWQLMSEMQRRPLLVVIDAVERWLAGWVGTREMEGLHDLSLRQGAQEGLDEFLQQASALDNGSHVILTSRALPAALDGLECSILPVLPKNASEVGLQALAPDAAIDLLERLGMVAPRGRLLELAKSLVCHPLALTGFARVAHRLGSHWESLLSGKGTDPSRVFHSLVDQIREHLPNRALSEMLLKWAALLPEGASLDLLEWMAGQETGKAGGTASQTDLLTQVLALADWSLVTWDAAAGSIRLHSLVAGYFSELMSAEERGGIHSRASQWYEMRAAKARGAEMSDEIFALRHALFAREGTRAFDIMFEEHGSWRCLCDRMTGEGHLWECAELLAALQESVSDLQKVHCIMVRARILNDLELSKRVLADVQMATRLVQAQGDTKWRPLKVLLAQCYGLEGIIHMETARATDALRLLEQAASLFEELAAEAPEFRPQLATTLANRGLAKWGCGDWDGAERDYQRTLELLPASTHDIQNADVLMALEMRARIAGLSLDRGEAEGAVRALESIIATFRQGLPSPQERPHKNHLMPMISLAAAHIAAGQADRALAVVGEALLTLEELSRHGRWEYHAVLAQARVNESHALLLAGRVAEAEEAASRAVGLYEDFMERGAGQFNGQLGNALFKRAEARIRLGDEKGRGDLRRALVIFKDWLKDWFGECNVQTVFLENVVEALPYLSTGHVEEKRVMLEITRQSVDRLLTAAPCAALIREEQILREKWPIFRAAASEVGCPWEESFPASRRSTA